MGNLFAGRKKLLAIVAVLVMSLSLSSCENVRKKFVRQKKKTEDKDFVPVLEPEEYPAPEHNPPLLYKQHYNLIKAWYKDLWSPLQDRYPSGTPQYALKEISGHIDGMQKLLQPQLHPELDKLRGFLKSYYNSLDIPPATRNRVRIESDLRAFFRLLIKQLSPGKVKGQFLPPSEVVEKPE